ncbi:SAC3 domain-containing protein 1 isoform X2 [Denticeps clupeoides]|nr:SAC3 domain-containing protein 1 isoform X2 [Denticeps clupeoides]
MCPLYELREREAHNRLHRFEILAGTEKDRRPRADVVRTVKEYSRPAAGKDSTRPSDLRPPSVLLKTTCYLIDEIAASPTLQPWTEVYSFVFDRLRSVRQDLIIQRCWGPECKAILERTVRFLLYASFRLCGEPLQLYDPKINDTHLQECLSWLLESYSQQHSTDTTQSQSSAQEEFHALNLLYNLGSTQMMQRVLELPMSMRSSPSVNLALLVSQAFVEQNPVRVLRLARRLDFLQVCALHRHIETCRRKLLLLYSHGYNSRNCRFPVSQLAILLGLDDALTAELCNAHGVTIQGQWVAFSKTQFIETPLTQLRCVKMHNMDMKQKDFNIRSIINGSF